jgi:hypothetical protein
MANTSSQTALQTPFLDANGRVSWTWLKLLQQWQKQLSAGFDQNGNLISSIAASVQIIGHDGSIGTILAHIDANGIVLSDGLPAATPDAQGAVKLAAGSVGNTLGSAAMQPASAFDAAGAAAAAQTAAETHADAVSSQAQSNAEAFASNAANITSGILDTNRLGGLSAVITTAALTGGGSQGSMTFHNGLLVAQTQAT